jgi:hypothetical protein
MRPMNDIPSAVRSPSRSTIRVLIQIVPPQLPQAFNTVSVLQPEIPVSIDVYDGSEIALGETPSLVPTVTVSSNPFTGLADHTLADEWCTHCAGQQTLWRIQVVLADLPTALPPVIDALQPEVSLAVDFHYNGGVTNPQLPRLFMTIDVFGDPQTVYTENDVADLWCAKSARHLESTCAKRLFPRRFLPHTRRAVVAV